MLRTRFPALIGIFVLSSCATLGGGEPSPVRVDPNSPGMMMEAPAQYRVAFQTSEGDFVVDVTREWAPRGADRFYNLVRNRFYDGNRFFRVLPGFVVQFGLSGDSTVTAAMKDAYIPDDPVRQSNMRGTITFASAGPNTRTTQVFINLANNPGLDRSGFAPFGVVASGMDVVDRLFSGYGEGPPQGNGPDQFRLELEGNAYLEAEFPELDYIGKATVIE